MKKLFVFLSVMVLVTVSIFGQSSWSVDPVHSKVIFSLSHMMISDFSGRFDKFDGKITSSKDDFSDLSVDFTIDVNSINSDNEKRNGHLKSEDYFDVVKFPVINFKSTSFTKVQDKMYKLAGNLTMKGVTKPMEFDVEYRGTVNNKWGTVAGFKVKGKINRIDYSVGKDTPKEAIGEEVEITANLELNKQK